MRRHAPQALEGDWYLTTPFKIVYAGLALGALAMLAELIDGTLATFLRVVLLVAGLLAGGGAVWLRLSEPKPDDFEERSKTGILMALASGTVLFAWVALSPAWDSLRLFTIVLWIVTLISVPVLLLPRVGRRIVVSLMVLYHFGGMLTTTTAVQPHNNGAMPWVPSMLWNHVYRNYLYFTYLNNAYHFYSPEPGPPSLVWFQVIYDTPDGEKTYWKRLVRREDFPTRQQYQRFLSLTESVRQPGWNTAARFAALQQHRAPFSIEGARHQTRDKKKIAPIISIPPEFQNWSADQLYNEPGPLAKRYLVSYASYVCSNTKHPDYPDAVVKGVRVYRLTHGLIAASQLEAGLKPTDPTFFVAYFYGEYEFKPDNKDVGKPVVELRGSPYEHVHEHDLSPRTQLVWHEPMPNGTTEVRSEPVPDPYLYWLLPIYRRPKDPSKASSNRLEDYVLIDSLSIHSGDTIKWEN